MTALAQPTVPRELSNQKHKVKKNPTSRGNVALYVARVADAYHILLRHAQDLIEFQARSAKMFVGNASQNLETAMLGSTLQRLPRHPLARLSSASPSTTRC